MAKTYYDHDADLTLIQAKKVAIIGYGSQGHAHSLNLKDSGVQVKVGLAANSRSIAKAQKAGLEVDTVPAVTKWADVVMVLVPDQTAAKLYADEIAPNLSAGKLLLSLTVSISISRPSLRLQASMSAWPRRGAGASRARSLH